ncbi:MAG: glycosyltransferase family 4 protein [Propionibacteriaceae bacterium]|nr:glycosyltransferase family 4 protein [Propionibacteriaceae bacterium]
MSHLTMRSLAYIIMHRLFDQVVLVTPAQQSSFWLPQTMRSAVVLPNIVDPNRIVMSREKRWDLAYLGRFSPEKRPDTFVEIVERVHRERPDLRSVMIGDGPLSASIKGQVAAWHLDNVIDVVGFQPHPERFLAESRICLVTSRFEGSPVSVMEALLAGVPVIGPDVGGMADLIDPSVGHLSTGTADTVQQCLRLLGDPEALDTLSSAAHKKALERNDASHFRAILNRLYAPERA